MAPGAGRRRVARRDAHCPENHSGFGTLYAPGAMTYVIVGSCIKDDSCIEVCPVDCIHPKPGAADFETAEQLYIDPEVCIDCDACVEACPVDAIFPDFDIPGEVRLRPRAQRGVLRRPGHRRADRGVMARARPRVAIVGAGPAGAFAAAALLRANGDTDIDLIERLPTPWGLLRGGVAPDHQEIKRLEDTFDRQTLRHGCRFLGNVAVGVDVSHDELMRHYDAVVYATGAQTDKSLGIPGEELPGSWAATEFVGWYNGHPDFRDLEFDLSGERAVVIGNGNVAADVTRILMLSPAELERTDVADHALAALRESRIREVVVLGRRGPAQAAFTSAELRELGRMDGVDMRVDPAEVELDPVSRAWLDEDGTFTARKNVELLREFAAAARAHRRGAPHRAALPVLAGRDPRRRQGRGRRRPPQRDRARGRRLAARPSGRRRRRDDPVRPRPALRRLPRRPAPRRPVRGAPLRPAQRARPGARRRTARRFRASTPSAGSSAGPPGSWGRTSATPRRPWPAWSRTSRPARLGRPRTTARRSTRCSPSAASTSSRSTAGGRSTARSSRSGRDAQRPRVKLASRDELLDAAHAAPRA